MSSSSPRSRGDVAAHVSDDFAHGKATTRFKVKVCGQTQELDLFMADARQGSQLLMRARGKSAHVTAMRLGNDLLILNKSALVAAGSSASGALVQAGSVVQGDQKNALGAA